MNDIKVELSKSTLPEMIRTGRICVFRKLSPRSQFPSVFLIVCHLLFLPSGLAQPPKVAAFEVASIRIHPAGRMGMVGFYNLPGGRVELNMCNIERLIEYALNVDARMIAGLPEWATRNTYDITAIPPEDSRSRRLHLEGQTATPTVEQREMILALLVERFGFKYHIEDRVSPVYFLDRGRGTLKLRASLQPDQASDPRGDLVVRGDFTTGEGFGENVTMSFLARQLTERLDRPVIDRTELKGIYDFRVDPIELDNRDSLRGALLMTQALGLKLRAGHAAMSAIQVDAVALPAEN